MLKELTLALFEIRCSIRLSYAPLAKLEPFYCISLASLFAWERLLGVPVSHRSGLGGWARIIPWGQPRLQPSRTLSFGRDGSCVADTFRPLPAFFFHGNSLSHNLKSG